MTTTKISCIFVLTMKRKRIKEATQNPLTSTKTKMPLGFLKDLGFNLELDGGLAYLSYENIEGVILVTTDFDPDLWSEDFTTVRVFTLASILEPTYLSMDEVKTFVETDVIERYIETME